MKLKAWKKKLITFFKVRLKKKPVFIIRTPRSQAKHRALRKSRIASVVMNFCSSKSMERRSEVRSPSCRTEKETLIYPSPITPACIKQKKWNRKQSSSCDDVEDACISRFEKHLLEMASEDGKIRDLRDVEEFLYCWKNLKCPVFIDLVCRFYGELCTELFSCNNEEDCSSPKRTTN